MVSKKNAWNPWQIQNTITYHRTDKLALSQKICAQKIMATDTYSARSLAPPPQPDYSLSMRLWKEQDKARSGNEWQECEIGSI